MRKALLSIVAAALAGALLAVPAAQAAEVPLKGISGWPKNFPLTPDFLRFIEYANKAGGGAVQDHPYRRAGDFQGAGAVQGVQVGAL